MGQALFDERAHGTAPPCRRLLESSLRPVGQAHGEAWHGGWSPVTPRTGQYAHLAVENDVANAVTGPYAQHVPDGLGKSGLSLFRHCGFEHVSTSVCLTL